ncbi:hypothetical protein [Limnobacter sp.]|uniref:hypothetical protein n=1 Tax=Limnobacter sp. TaxID=2003368 RepID=UPI0025C3E0B2|nr:hypothetical protein [Limnobacter sp.]
MQRTLVPTVAHVSRLLEEMAYRDFSVIDKADYLKGALYQAEFFPNRLDCFGESESFIIGASDGFRLIRECFDRAKNNVEIRLDRSLEGEDLKFLKTIYIAAVAKKLDFLRAYIDVKARDNKPLSTKDEILLAAGNSWI